MKYGEFIDDLDKLAKRRTKRKFPDRVKTIDVEQEDVETMLLRVWDEKTPPRGAPARLEKMSDYE